jgi:hypothetical protein
MPEPQKRTITRVRDASSEQQSSPTHPIWFIDMDVEGAHPWIYVIPHSTFFHRSAEYGLDPSDFDTLLDVVIHEHHFELHHTDPTFLYNTDEKTAREAHLARVAAAKQRVTHQDPHGLLDTIRKAYDPNDPLLTEACRRMQEVRARMKNGRTNRG